MMNKWLVAVLGSAALLLSTGALAQKQQAATQGFYVGGEVGKFDADNDDDTAVKILGGYQFHRNFAAEFSYGNLLDKGGVEVTAWELVVVGLYPVGNNLSLLGKLGFAMWDIDTGITGSRDGTDLTFGLGVHYDLNPKLGIRGQWQRYDINDNDADLFSIGLVYKF